MIKKFLKVLFTLVGGLVGYGVFMACKLYIESTWQGPPVSISDLQLVSIGLCFSIFFAIIFYKLTPTISKQGIKIADNIEADLRLVSGNDVLVGTIGLVTGLVIALLITQIYSELLKPYVYIYFLVTILTYLLCGYMGIVIATKKGVEIFSGLNSGKNKNQNPNDINFNKTKKNKDAIPKIFDTSVIIDGRIAEILKTGFLEGPIVIPEFVLVELRHIADSSDSLKRIRGRRGLDILNKIQEDYGIEIYNTDNEKVLKEIPEVDVKLLKLAQLMNGKVVTNDFNLNKVAAINGIAVLNINELANTLKPVVLPGEEMSVDLVKQGKDNNQAVAYLDDGTMIVVEDGRKKIGMTTNILVTSVLQTTAGRMIFGRLKN